MMGGGRRVLVLVSTMDDLGVLGWWVLAIVHVHKPMLLALYNSLQLAIYHWNAGSCR